MTNYLVTITAALALFTGACSAADTPAAPAKPAAAAPKPAAAAPKPAAAAASPVAAASTAGALPHYVQAPAGSSLAFSFEQAGAQNQGVFKQFSTELVYDENNLAASTLKVTVQITSLDTQDKDRDNTLASADLLDPKKFPTATFIASSFAKRAGGVDAVGKLTLRGVTRDLRVPLTIRLTTAGAEIAGETTLKRLDYGVGQGEWKSTEWVGADVKLQYKVSLVKAAR
jgi:polyisoprenoid-binding protein YceI